MSERAVRYKEKLLKLCGLPDNDKCCDCGQAKPLWVSLTFGCIVCIRCSGVHRSLGTHVSRVRSIELDEWSSLQVKMLQKRGNRLVNSILEAVLSETKKPDASTPSQDLAQYIAYKYADQKFRFKPKTEEEKSKFDQETESLLLLNYARKMELRAEKKKKGFEKRRHSSPSLKAQTIKSNETETSPDEDEEPKSERGDGEDEAWDKFQRQFDIENLKEIQKNERKRMMEEAKQRKREKSRSGGTLRKKRPLSDYARMDVSQTLNGTESSTSEDMLSKRKKRLSASISRLKHEIKPKRRSGSGELSSLMSPRSPTAQNEEASDGPRATKSLTLSRVDIEKGANNSMHNSHSPRSGSKDKKNKKEKTLNAKELEDYERMKARFLAEALACEAVSDSDDDAEEESKKKRAGKV